MRNCLYALLLACSLFMTVDLEASWKEEAALAKESANKQDYKSAAAHYSLAIAAAPAEMRGSFEAALALIYYRDQDQKKAFECFLEALDHAASVRDSAPASEDTRLYEEAFALYSNKNDVEPQQIAKQILEKYEKIVVDHPHYFLLQFIVAASDGNLGKYDHFFERFYASYVKYPDHFLSHKMRAILQIKLMELGQSVEEKAYRRKLALSSVEKALEKNCRDGTLYRLALAFSVEQNEKEKATLFLKRMLENSTVISRLDICPYVQLAVDLGERELAQKIVDRSKELYAYSRAVAAAQQYLSALGQKENK